MPISAHLAWIPFVLTFTRLLSTKHGLYQEKLVSVLGQNLVSSGSDEHNEHIQTITNLIAGYC